MRAFKIGNFRNRIEVQEALDSRDAYNDRERSWSTIATEWAWVTPLRGKEILEADQAKSQISHRVVILWTGTYTLTTRHRLVLGGRVLQIESVANIEEGNRYLDIMATETEGVTA